MKLVWCPVTAKKAYVDTVISCEALGESSVAELLSALAGGWSPQLIVETWYQGGVITTSLGLAVATHHTRSRHVCIVPDEQTRSAYLAAMHEACGISPETAVGEVEEVMSGLSGIDFLVVDFRRDDFERILRVAKLGRRAVFVCKNYSPVCYSNFQWRRGGDGGPRIVRSRYHPVGDGLEILYVAGDESAGNGARRWVRYIDEQSGEEHVYRDELTVFSFC